MISMASSKWCRTLLIVLTALVSTSSIAQSYPTRPIKLVVPFTAGGGTDLVGRVLAEGFTRELGQPVVIDNRGGAGTAIGTGAVANAPPDGYTMLLNGGSMSYLSAFVAKLPYNVGKDFRHVSTVSEQPFVLTVRKSLKVNNVKEFIALAKAKPATLNFVSAGIGSATHMESEVLWREMKISLVHVPYKGTGSAVTDLIAGNVDVMYTTLAAAAELIRGDKVKALAVSSSSRSSEFGGIPTLGETMDNQFVQLSTLSIFVPAATPMPVAERLLLATRVVLADPAVASRLKDHGVTLIASKSLMEAEVRQKSELKRWAEITRLMNIKPE